MARAKAAPTESTPEVTADALGLLERDHWLIEELFAEFRRSAPQQLDPLARRICKLLRVHTQIEEELFYPVVRRVLTHEVSVHDAEREHAEAKAAIVRIESMTSDHPQFKHEVAALSEQVAQHVRREEDALFVSLRGARLDLAGLGVALAERRDTLLDVLGLHHDDEEGAANQREARQPAATQRPSDKGLHKL
jgi:hemerythrin HHE cation binding domain-containing protein